MVAQFYPDTLAKSEELMAEMANLAFLRLRFNGHVFVMGAAGDPAITGLVTTLSASVAAAAASVVDASGFADNAAASADAALVSKDGILNFETQLGNVAEADIILNSNAITVQATAMTAAQTAITVNTNWGKPDDVTASGDIANGAFLTAKSNAGAIDLAIPNAGDYYVKVVRDGSNLVKVTGAPVDHEIDIDNTGVEMWKTDGIHYYHVFVVNKNEAEA